MPVVSTLALGQQFYIINSSTGRVTVNSSGGNFIATALAGQTIVFTCILVTGTTAASWSYAAYYTNQIAGGTWTPTLTNVTNAAASSVLQDFTYTRVDNVCTGGGALSIDPTATGTVQVDFTIPIASAFVTSYDLNGIGSSGNTTNGVAALIADTTNDRCSIFFTAADTANRNWRVNFQYIIK
jgi:hypothetical protein